MSLNSTDEQHLLHLAQEGDSEAFGSLFELRTADLHAHCYRILASFDDADDAVQETLLRAWRALPQFESCGSLRTWLFKIASDAALDIALRRAKREVRVALLAVPEHRAHPGPSSQTCLGPRLGAELGLITFTVEGAGRVTFLKRESRTAPQASVSRTAVNRFTEKIGMSVVPRILLDHVDEDPTNVTIAARSFAARPYDVVERAFSHGISGCCTLFLKRGEVGDSVGLFDLFEVEADAVGVVWIADIFLRCVHPKPPALNLDHVSHQSQQRKPRRRHGALLQLLRGEPSAFRQEGGAVVVEPLFETRSLVRHEVRLGSFDSGCGPDFGHMSSPPQRQ
jgi:RNA polymerase sigma factor (sigma-70 family)